MTNSTNVEFFCGTVPVIDRPMGVLRIKAPDVTRPSQRHISLVLDCSASMTSSLGSVKTNACEVIDELDETDHVSVTIFSGHDTAKRIIGPVQCTDTGKTMLKQAIERDVRIMNTTVFSEPLNIALRDLRQINIKDMANMAVLFTDGMAVPTRWTVHVEHERALRIAKELYEFGAAVSVIGYGAYYDAEFMTRIMQASGSSGVYRHMSDVEDFTEVIRDIRNTFARINLSDIDLKLTPQGQAQITSVYRSLPEVAVISNDHTVITRGLYEGEVTYYLDLSEPTKALELSGSIAGLEVNASTKAGKLTDKLAAECLRVVAAQLIIAGTTQEAIEILQETGDEGLAEAVADSFTEREKRTNRDRMRRAFRERKFIGAGLKPTGPNHNVINTLRELIEDTAAELFLAPGAYKRGGIAKADPRVVYSPVGKRLKVVGYTSHESRFNFSVTAEIPVQVLPADDEGNVINGPTTEAKITRTYNIVRDGELVMRELLASISENTFQKYQEAGIIAASEKYKPGKAYTLDFANMKMVSSAWARPGSLGLVRLLRQEKDLEAEQKALNARIKAIGKPETPEFSASGHYHEQAVAAEELPVETYTARHAEVRLMKYKVQRDYAAEVAQLSYDEANTRVKAVRRQLRQIRWLIRSIDFACHITGWQSISWSTPVANRYGKLESEAMYGDAHLKLVTWESEVAYS